MPLATLRRGGGRILFPARRTPSGESPLPLTPSELLNIERLEERAKALAAAFMLARQPRAAGRAYLTRLRDNERLLRETYRTLADDVHRGEAITPATEWLLDNVPLVR